MSDKLLQLGLEEKGKNQWKSEVQDFGDDKPRMLGP